MARDMGVCEAIHSKLRADDIVKIVVFLKDSESELKSKREKCHKV